ncbi:unnamed protein product [Prorocentrum cordatum]|uniref:Sacsin/Nov domain-containing protein n=1 Tax=Prorocentrum cordatum TaxID=2364126 RepID=A0ABN9VF79_9DINO|nr:unnamed protein product [Polarella glacialis]
MADAIADPGFGLKISPGVVLRNLLQQYPSGGQFFLEALQNADDTGRAGKFCALLDLRRHPSKSLRPPSAARSLLQGESIVFYDDAGFKQRDWRSLQFMCDSVKRQSPHEAGAFGMGSRSFFHITDVLQVLSGSLLASLDPDDILESGRFGEQVNFVNEKLFETFPDEGAPFHKVFGCDLKSSFHGSIIRASLRTVERASKCTFMPQAFELSRAMRIFKEFEETMRNGEVLLFLTSVKCIELWRWDDGSPEPAVVARTRLGVSSGHKLPRAISGPAQVKAFLQRCSSFAELGALLRESGATPPEIHDIITMETEVLSSGGSSGTTATLHWLRYGSFSKDAEELSVAMQCNCVPMVALALPLGQAADGCLFASLPLPLTTKLPVHVNAYFRLHDNRRNIWRLSPDLDGEHRMWAQWNERLLTGMVPLLYAQALELLASTAGVAADHGHSLWPREQDVEREFRAILDPLVRSIKEMRVLPTPTGELVRPVDALFFQTHTTALQACRQRLLRVCADRGWKVVDPPEHVTQLLHGRNALAQKPCSWVLHEVIIPFAAEGLENDECVSLLLPFVEWAGSWNEPEIKDLGRRLADVKWLPTECGEVRTVAGSFDPAKSPEALRIVRDRRAKIDGLIKDLELSEAAVWRVLQLCGLKTEITWEDAVEDAEAAAAGPDVERARNLFVHVNKRHSSLRGSRVASLKKLQDLAWVPAVEPSKDPGATEAAKLRTIAEVFPPGARKLIWAVAPTMFMDAAVSELKPGRAVEKEAGVLVDQVRALADSADKASGRPPFVGAQTLDHLRATFGAMLPLLAKLPGLEKDARLAGVAFVPCMPSEGSEGADLFDPQRAAFSAKHNQTALSPALGLVRQSDHSIRVIAEAVGVTKEPRSEVLGESLCCTGENSPKPALATVLAIELAARLRAKCARPARILVPTASGGMQAAEEVYIDDMPWRAQRDHVTLHPDVPADDGAVLGCTSLCQRIASQSEADKQPGGDPFGDRADLVSHVRKLLQECGDGHELILEFVKHYDAAGAGAVAFFLWEQAFGTDRVLDPRTAALQGPALYVCCDRPTSPEEVLEMQAVGSVKRPVDFGINAMYRYTDCPQLVAGGVAHFFDLARHYVVRPGARRGRPFVMEKLRGDFPDSHAPLDVPHVVQRFPTVFRLPLRKERSELGLGVEVAAVRSALSRASAAAEKALLFARHLRRLEFHDGTTQLAVHSLTIGDPDGFEAFFAGLPATPGDLKAGELRSHMATKTIALQSPQAEGSAEWAVSHAAGVASEDMVKVAQEWAGREGAKRAVPCGAAALRIKPSEDDKEAACFCRDAPTPFRTNSRAWIHGSFWLPPACRALQVPEEGDAKPTLEKRWNRLLVEGPVTESMRGLILRATELAMKRELDTRRYFGLFPSKGDRLQSLLSQAVFDVDWILSKAILPTAARSGRTDELAGTLLALLEWAGSWKEAEIRDLGKKLADVKWVPVEEGDARTITESFVPDESPKEFSVVVGGRAKIDELISAAGLKAEVVWRVMKLCGMKRDLTWEDATREAEAVVRDADVDRAKLLFAHIGKRHASFQGSRATAMEKLGALPWVPARPGAFGGDAGTPSKLLPLAELFAPAACKVVWAVAPSMFAEPPVKELQPGRSVEAEPEVLVEQVRALAQAAASSAGAGAAPRASPAALEHLLAAFAALLPLLSKLPGLATHPRLEGVAFIPCLAGGEAEEKGADLFTPGRAAFSARRAPSELHPAVGLVKRGDATARLIAEAAGVAKEPRAEALAEAVRQAPAGEAGMQLAVACACELAARLRAKEARPPGIAVPTSCGRVERFEQVFIDDAPWRKQTEIVTLHPKIGAEDGRELGCTSLREAMALRSQAAAGGDAPDPLGEAPDLVGRVRQLLQDYGDAAEVIPEFILHEDAAGASSVAVFLREEAFGTERVVDLRTAALQGPALYLCSDRKLSPEDVPKLMRLGDTPGEGQHESRRLGPGLTAMYRYCDCPQLLACGGLTFADVTGSFVAKPGARRGLEFSAEKLRESFPDHLAPFEEAGLLERFPLVLRLALRADKSELGLKVSASAVRAELQRASAAADKLLLFARGLRRVELADGAAPVGTHSATPEDPEGHLAFFEAVSAAAPEPKAGATGDHVSCVTVASECGGKRSEARWLLACAAGAHGPAGAAAPAAAAAGAAAGTPWGAAAVRLGPSEKEQDVGKVCCGMPTAFRTNSSAWVSAPFALPPSRKSLPLPDEQEQKPPREKAWNRQLLEGPVAASLRKILVRCTDMMLKKELATSRYFALVPSRGERLQNLLAAAAYSLDWLLFEVMIPAASGFGETGQASLLLTVLEWAGSWKEADIRELGRKLGKTKWIPTEEGVLRTIEECFEPLSSLADFRVSSSRKAAIEPLVADAGLDRETVWRVLRLCGLKAQLTWEDLVEEAEAVAREGDVKRAKLLLAHLNGHHSALVGSRAAALERLKALAWLPAKQTSTESEPPDATALVVAKDAFPASASKLVWAVAQSLVAETAVAELRPGRSIEKEPGVLIEQLNALVVSNMAPSGSGGGGPPRVSNAVLAHMREVFAAMLPLLSKLQGLDKHPLLEGVAFVPCLPADDATDGVDLYAPRSAAFRAQQTHRALSPVIGLVKPGDQTIKLIAEAAGVAKEPRADVLAAALDAPEGEEGEEAPVSTDLAVALAIELAVRLRAKEPRPAKVVVPTVLNTVRDVGAVFIDDAPWQSEKAMVTLHPRISAEDGRMLGCSSLREEMTRQCEEGDAAQDGDAFGQEADLVSQVKQLLQEYGEQADLVKEFVQNCDDAGATNVAFFIHEPAFGSERVVDPRTASLQGPALYVCSDKALNANDIARMQNVGSSKKRMDFSSSGRFGVGLNVMYRYCDCPQLLANNRLHYFDLTRGFVAKPGARRGRQFTIEKLKENFPDSHTPFEIERAASYPTVFRLALRPARSELGMKMGLTTVRGELQASADMADKMLLFARNMKHVEFYDNDKLIATVDAEVKDPEQYAAFFRGLPPSPLELKPGQIDAYLAQKTITMERTVTTAEGEDEEKAPDGKTSADWAIAHRVGVSDENMLKVLKAQYDQPHGVALLPHGAAAAQIQACRGELRGGRICVGLPTPFQTNSAAWVHGNFALLSSRKTLPLPEEKEPRPSLDKSWNRMLIRGPVAMSMKDLILHCSAQVLYRGMGIDRYFGLFPLRGDRLQSLLAAAVFKLALPEAVFPVARGDKLTWVSGPSPTFVNDELPEALQDNLVDDGMRLVKLPAEIVAEYEEVRGRPRERLAGPELCKFLAGAWAQLHPPPKAETGEGGGAPVAPDVKLDATGLSSLSTRSRVVELLGFAVKSLWAEFCKSQPANTQTFAPAELEGVPLLLTNDGEVTTFGNGVKFSTWRDILPTKGSLFMDRDAHVAATTAVDISILGTKGAVDVQLPGVRAFTLGDLVPHKEEVEASVRPVLGFCHPENEPLRLLWSLVADTYAEKLQGPGENPFASRFHARMAAEAASTQTVKVRRDTSWCKLINDWRVLPICSCDGGGENGENCIPLNVAHRSVAVTLVSFDDAVVESLSGILQECGIETVQHDVMSDDRISRLVRTLVICDNDDMLKALVDHGRIDSLSALQRHDLLAYFSVLSVKGGAKLEGVKNLALFKTASVEKTFISLKDPKTQYCCIDPSDPHAASLSQLTLPGMCMLAWPTQQVKPIYEYCGVQLCSGEEFMVSMVIRELPSICGSDKDGSASLPFLQELHSYVYVDQSESVRRAAAACEFVPSED